MEGEKENWDGATGALYREAEDEMRAIDERLRLLSLHDSEEEAIAEMRECQLGHFAYKAMSQNYVCSDNRGRLLTSLSWKHKYGRKFSYLDDVGKIVCVDPVLEGIEHSDAEEDAYSLPALYRRDYFRPWGHYDAITRTFNAATPCMNWAEDHPDVDVSHIFTYLKALAGVNYVYLCAWLRAKLLDPHSKTEVMPMFVSREQGTGKTTFAEVICKGLFGAKNVLVTEQFDASARFNADSADALIICIEERQQNDRRNTESSIKSQITNPNVRKEYKGRDPFYQKSCTDFIMTTNDDVPIKFESEVQRRFMVMEVDSDFTRANPMADAVFTKLYGFDGERNKRGPGFVNNPKEIQKFKWEILNKSEFKNVNLAKHIKTDAFRRCVDIPRTAEAVDIENIIHAIMPFVSHAFKDKKVPKTIVEETEQGPVQVHLERIIPSPEGIAYFHPHGGKSARVAVNRGTVFSDLNGRQLAPSVVAHGLLAAKDWIRKTYGIELIGDTKYPSGGFPGIESRHRYGMCAWFVLAPPKPAPPTLPPPPPSFHDVTVKAPAGNTSPVDAITDSLLPKQGAIPRNGRRVRYDGKTFMPHPEGEYETLNEVWEGKGRGKEAAAHLDNFLLECDTTTRLNKEAENRILEKAGAILDAETLYHNRLALQTSVLNGYFAKGIVWRLVYSGMKSIHALVRVSPAPENLAQRRWLFAYLCRDLGKDRLEFDSQVGDPTRLTRAPVLFIREKDMGRTVIRGRQRLLREDPTHVYRFNWKPMYEAWANAEKSKYEARGVPMLPSAPIYKEAAQAFLDGTYFSDTKFDGMRQQTFFPLYRIVRALNYTPDEFWAAMDAQLESYPQARERNYWRSRRDCRLIQEIESEFEGVEGYPT
jgi:hypothetical protein